MQIHSLLRLVILPFVLFFSSGSYATHMMGADITYQHVGGMRYRITLKYYRDCSGVALGNPSPGTHLVCLGGFSTALPLVLESIREVTPICDSEPPRCNPPNTFGTGNGIEEHTYYSVVDFSLAPYNSLLACSGKLIVQTSHCCRPPIITTGAASQNFFTYSSFDFDLSADSNSSPVFQYEPILFKSVNTPFIYSVGAIDTIDNDSLSYTFDHPLSAYGSQIPYDSGLAYNRPFTAYNPLGDTVPNPNVVPPTGVYMDPETGTIYATPVKLGEVTTLVIKVSEWRKDTAGTYQIISEVRRDIQLFIDTSRMNNPPFITIDDTSRRRKGVAACVNFELEDKTYIPPPPTPVPPPDTLEFYFSGDTAGLQITVDPTRSKVNHIYGTLCYDSAWTTQGARTIFLYISDNACPINNILIAGYRLQFDKDSVAAILPVFPNKSIRVYPNPTTGEVHFRLASEFKRQTYSLISMQGKKVRAGTTTPGINSISMHDLSDGVYYLKLDQTGHVARIMKQKTE